VPFVNPNRAKRSQPRNTPKAKTSAVLPKEPLALRIDNLSNDGRGVSRTLDKVTFVSGALPGEQVLAKITAAHRSFNEAQLISRENDSPLRAEPFCPHYEKCGGCQLQHVHEDEQIHLKQQWLEQLFYKQHHLTDLPWQVPLVAESRAYRRRARLGIRYRNERDEVLIGFRESQNSHLQAIDACPVLVPALSALITPLQKTVQNLEGKARFTQVEMLQLENGIMLVLRYLKKLSAHDSIHLREFARQHNVQLWLEPDEPEAVYCLWPEDPQALYYSLHDGSRIDVQPKHFMQANGAMNRAMVQQALEWLQPKATERALDLFSGAGNFSVPMARVLQSVHAVEVDDAMVKAAQASALQNGVANLTVQRANLNTGDGLKNELQQADLILLDPPRAGAAELMPLLAKSGKRILYIACEASSLVRDAGALFEQGYRISKIGVMDMFPHTRHVETMALFERKK
jgi:23S rRNA (uracil1939-C5)-methyltransferase